MGSKRTPADLIWGWGTNGDRHPGILERLERVEKASMKNTKLSCLVLFMVVIDTATNAGGTLLDLLKSGFQLLPQLLGLIH